VFSQLDITRMPSPTPSKRTASAAVLRRQRMDQLESTVKACLRKADAVDAAQQAKLQDALSRWLDEADPSSRHDLFATLAEALQRTYPRLSAARHFDTSAVASAFARSLLEHGQQVVAREAARAGHANTYDTLSIWIENEADSAVLESLGQVLCRSPADLRTALGRLRHRLLQRVNASLAIWSDSPTARQNLRRRLRDALLSSETSA